MKPAGIILSLYLLLSTVVSAQPGTSCNNPYIILLDSVTRNYTISSVSGTALHCTGPLYSGSGYITIFSFTTDASASCVLIDLLNTNNQPAEAMLYTKCSGGGALQNVEETSTVCFNDGTGLWAPGETVILTPNKTYYLRIWTPNSGSLTLSAKSYPPPNDDCFGATIITPDPISDNNACHKPGPGVLPEYLCAFSLENTAFYSYTVDISGISVLMINNISCDNSSAGASSGFQIGFFTGNCNSLTPVNCYADTGGSVSASTQSFPSGTKITVAIDGMSGSNCTYTISAFNAVFLPVTIKYFTAWLAPASNQLRWQTSKRTGNAYFEIEKSVDGQHFFPIGRVEERQNASDETDYSFDDKAPMAEQFYRLRIIGENGRVSYSNIIYLKRGQILPAITLMNPASEKLNIRLNAPVSENLQVQILNSLGQVVQMRNIQLKRENSISLDIQDLANGLYYFVVTADNQKTSQSFIKQ
jgi:hypothetical protein